MEIIDTFRKALKLQVHTMAFIFLSKKFKTLQLSWNCLSTLQFSFWHTFSPPQLWRVFFPAPNKGTGSLGKDFASQISASFGGRKGSRGLTQSRRTLRCLFTACLAKAGCPCPRLVGPDRLPCPQTVGMLPCPHGQGCFTQSQHEAGSSAMASTAATSFPWHWWMCFCCDWAEHVGQPVIKAAWDPSNFPRTKRSHLPLFWDPIGLWDAG